MKTGGLLLFLILQSVVVFAMDETGVVRSQFPDVPVITLQELEHEYNSDIVIVDTRTRFEYETIHINKAVRVPVSSKSFLKLLERYVPDLNTRVVFYCNGGSCSKSFRAAELAIKAGYRNAYSFAAGIFAWAKAHPDRTTLLDVTPMDQSQLISEVDFEEHTISYEQFLQRLSGDPSSIVVDVRDATQRRNSDGTRNDFPNLPTLDRKRHQILNLDLFKRRLEQGEYRGEPLLIFDAAGKQVKWLQYSLEKSGYRNYFFLDGGIFSVTDVVHH